MHLDGVFSSVFGLQIEIPFFCPRMSTKGPLPPGPLLHNYGPIADAPGAIEAYDKATHASPRGQRTHKGMKPA